MKNIIRIVKGICLSWMLERLAMRLHGMGYLFEGNSVLMVSQYVYRDVTKELK